MHLKTALIRKEALIGEALIGAGYGATRYKDPGEDRVQAIARSGLTGLVTGTVGTGASALGVLGGAYLGDEMGLSTGQKAALAMVLGLTGYGLGASAGYALSARKGYSGLNEFDPKEQKTQV